MAQDYSNLQRMAMQQSQTPMQPSPNRPKGGFGCIIVIVLAGFLLGMGLLVYFFVYPKYFSSSGENKEFSFFNSNDDDEGGSKSSKSSSLTGTLLNCIPVTGENEEELMWVMTSKYKSSKFYTYTYIYNPLKDKVIRSFETSSKDYSPLTKFYFTGGEVWKVNTESGSTEAGIFVYDPLTGDEKLNTKSFLEKYGLSGIGKMYTLDKPPSLNIETRDGRKVVFDIINSKLYDNSSDFRNSFKKDDKTISIFALGYEKSGEEARKKLFYVTGPRSNLYERNIPESYFTSESTLKFFTKSEAKVLLKDKIFLEGEMLYQDDDCCFIFHQDQVGSNAERMLTCVDSEGSVLWTASTERNLFTKLRASDKESTSGMFFIKHSVHVNKSGNLVLFSYDRFGFIGFDYKSGEKLFQKELSKQ